VSYTHSLVVLCPIADLAEAAAAAAPLGWTPNEFGVDLSADGFEPATHRGLHAWTRPEMAAIFTGDYVPPVLDSDAVAAALAKCTVSVRAPSDNLPMGLEHFNAVLAAGSLYIVGSVEPPPEEE
jgi:hypothetical protein